MQVKELAASDVALVATIDRSEHVEVQYAVIDGRLTETPVTMRDVPTWDPTDTGPHSVAEKIAFCAGLIAAGGVLFGAFVDTNDDAPAGLAIVNPTFEPRLAWLGWFYVSRPHRRRGVASALWAAAVAVSRAGEADAMYVSAVPTGAAISFYLRQGCTLADPVHPTLFAHEPDDIHLVCPLR